jgi:cytochrome P450
MAPETLETDGQAESTLADVGVLADPKHFYRAVRQERGLHYDPKLGAYLVSRYEDLLTVLQDPITFSLEQAWSTLWSEEFKAILERDGGGFFPDAIMTDPPNHTRVRRLVQKAFSPRRIKQLEPAITARVRELIESLADRGEADGVRALAIPVTIRIMAEQLGMTDVDLGTIDRWSTAFTLQIGRMLTPEQMAENARIVCECQRFVIDMVRQRQEHPSEDLISDLVQARSEEDNNPVLTFGEIIATARAFLIGGNESISTALSNMLFTLATRPDLAEQLHDSLDDDRIFSRFVEELIRIAPPARATSRVVTRDVELGGQPLKKGSLVITMFASANDDETQFSQPRAFDIERPNLASHMGFGAGPHICVGVALARMEVKVVTRETVRLLKDIKLAVPAEDLPYRLNIANHALESLPLTFSRRRAA